MSDIPVWMDSTRIVSERILSYLGVVPEATVEEMAKKLELVKATVSSTVSVLKNAKYPKIKCRIEISKKNRRGVYSLSKDGESFGNLKAPIVGSSLSFLEKAISPKIHSTPPSVPVSNEWVEWSGGECPVSEDLYVEIRMRSLDTSDTLILPATVARWSHHDLPGDIVWYRVAPEHREHWMPNPPRLTEPLFHLSSDGELIIECNEFVKSVSSTDTGRLAKLLRGLA